MGKAKKKTAISKKEEQQAQKVVKIVFVSLIILALIMLSPFSFRANKKMAWRHFFMLTLHVDLIVSG